MALTDSGIRALKPKSIRYYVSDGRGLWLEVFPSGVRAWRYRYRLNGRPEKTALGKYPEMSLKLARQKRDELACLVAGGESPASQKRLLKAALTESSTLREFGERFYKEVVSVRVKDPKNLRRWLDNEIYPSLGDKPVREITGSDIQALIFRKRDAGMPASAAGIRNLIKRIFDYAIACGLATVNPAMQTPMKFIAVPRPRRRALEPPEIKAYVETLYRSNIRRQFKLALHLILLTLVRKSELLFAKWSDVNFRAGEWHIPDENSKTGRSHIVYMSRQVSSMFAELKQLADDSAWVLPGRGSKKKPFAKNALNKALEGINFPIQSFTVHDLRRTGSTRLHEHGFASDVIEKALNHTIGGVRGVYNRAEYSEQRKAMLQFWSDYVDGLIREKTILEADLTRLRLSEETVSAEAF
jgi:integrase